MALLSFIFLFFLFFFFFQDATTYAQNSSEPCESTRCNENGPEIKFPFWLNSQPSSCGLQGFQLSCSNDHKTLLHLPLSGNFYVQEISYLHKTLTILDSNDTRCPIQTLLSLNLSGSTFNIPYVSQTFAIVNCAESVSWTGTDAGIGPISCMSSQNNFVYIVAAYGSIDKLPQSCSSSAYSESKISTDLGLGKGIDRLLRTKLIRIGWEYSNGCRSCEDLGGYCVGFNSTTNDPQCSQRVKNEGSSHQNVIIGLSVGGTIVLVVVLLFFSIRIRKSNREKEIGRKLEKFLVAYKNQSPVRYTYSDVKKMTNKFNHKIGQGGHGSVYRGELLKGEPVAVKVMNSSKDGNEFMNEISTISRIHHFNVVRLLGYCSEGARRALVYEYMPNESLQKVMSREAKELSWVKMEEIAIGIAHGVEYLHQGCNQMVLHLDIKPHNILLDHNLQPKVSDFGMAMLCSKERGSVSMTSARGTEGYMAPEVLSRSFGEVSCKSDVYSFGMLLLEMVGSYRKKEMDAEVNPIGFPEWIYDRVSRGEELGLEVKAEGEEEIAKKLAIVGLWCIQWDPTERPSMSTVIQMLEGDYKLLDIPPKPFVSSHIVMGLS